MTRGRHARSKWDWGTEPSRNIENRDAVDEQLVADGGKPPPKTAGRKNTSTWCKGKEGRPHQETVTRSHHHAGQPCQWQAVWVRRGPGGAEYKIGWHCYHEITCAGCGRILTRHWELASSRCPGYPGDPQQREAAEVKLREWQQRDRTRRWRRKPPPDGPQGYRKPKAAKDGQAP